MPNLRSRASTGWGVAVPLRSHARTGWGVAVPLRSRGFAYINPLGPPDTSVDGTDPDLAPRSEILPAASYRSTAMALMRNVRALGEPFRYFYAPLVAGAQDTIDPLATFTVFGSPSFSAAGMLSTSGAWISYPQENTKLGASQHAAGIRYSVRCENMTSMPPPFNSSGTRIFTLNGLGHQFGFMTGISGTLRVYEFHVTTNYDEVSFGVIPGDCVLSIVYPAGSGVGELWINDTKVYTSPYDGRFDGGITLGLQAAAAISSLRLSQLRMERIPALTKGLALQDGQVIQAISGNIDMPDGSALWRLNATVPRVAYDALRSGDQPPLVSVEIAAKTWVFLVDDMSAPRAFAATDVEIRGVSLAALADTPYELARQWTSDAPTTAAQIATLAQTFTGLEVSWQLPDWPVPAGGWSFSGSPWGAVLQAAASVLAVVEAHPSDLAVTVSSRYPIAPASWASTAPDVQVPWQAVDSETVTAADQPAYTGVYVAGPAATIAAVRLAGTSGAQQAPLITHELLTDLDGQAERGRAVLGASGGAKSVTRKIQVLAGADAPGVLSRGQLVRWVDPAETWVGMVRGLSVEWEFGKVRQTVACERRTSFPTGVFVPAAPACPDIHWSSVILYLPMDTDFSDMSRYRRTATVVNQAQITATDAKFVGCGLFDGTGDRVTFENDPLFNVGTADFTLQFWVRANSYSSGPYIVAFRTVGQGWYVNLNTGGNLVWGQSGAINSALTFGSLPATGTWSHVALVRTGGVLRAWVNGTQSGVDRADTTDYTGNTADMVIGADWNGTNCLDGRLDDLRLSLVAEYDAPFTPPTAPHHICT